MENNEQKTQTELWQEFPNIISRQLEISTELKNIIENFAGASSHKTAPDLSEEQANKLRGLFVEMEALTGEERAVYHSLFGIDE